MSTLMIHFNKNDYLRVNAVLDKNPPLKSLLRFASTPWVMVQAVFLSAGIECPLEFRIFHTAYQENLRKLS